MASLTTGLTAAYVGSDDGGREPARLVRGGTTGSVSCALDAAADDDDEDEDDDSVLLEEEETRPAAARGGGCGCCALPAADARRGRSVGARDTSLLAGAGRGLGVCVYMCVCCVCCVWVVNYLIC